MIFFLRNDKYGQEMKINSKCPTSAIAFTAREVCEGMVTETTVVVEAGWLKGMKSVLLATHRGEVALLSTVAAGLVASLALVARVVARRRSTGMVLAAVCESTCFASVTT